MRARARLVVIVGILLGIGCKRANRLSLALLAVQVLLISPTSQALFAQRIVSEVDPIEGAEITKLDKHNFVVGDRDMGGPMVALDPSAIRSETGDVSHFLRLTYYGRDWLFIREEDPVVIVADSNRVRLSPIRSPVREPNVSSVLLRMAKMKVTETVTFLVEPSFLREIAGSEEVLLRVYGDNEQTTVAFEEKNFKIFEKWVKEVLTE